MNKVLLLVLALTCFSQQIVFGQNMTPGARSTVYTPYQVYGSQGYNTFSNPGVRYGYPAYPYNTIYGTGNPYYSGYQGQYNIGGIAAPVYGPPQLIRGEFYGINYGGAPWQFWRAPSGFYYPWVGGYGYSAYPIYVVPPNSAAPAQTTPPVSTVVSDLDDYLDKAKSKGKISMADYQSLRLRANDLLSKEKALTYEQGGVIDPDSEAEIRRDLDGLSAEVAHRVRP